MTSPDLSIPDMETYETVKPQINQAEGGTNDKVKVDQKRMKMIQLSEIW